ncbi:MAG: ABC transporter permease [Chlorobium sp.]|nr:ABC transporter permease [Chlorobium sp.]
MFRDLLASRELAWRLTVRDIRAQYRQTFLGFLWAIILPLANTLVWIFLSKNGIVNVRATELPYPIFVFTGTMLWAIFIDAVNAPLQVTTAAKPMLAKINFPRESLVMAGVYQTLFNASIKIVLLLVALLFQGIFPGWTLLLFPLGILSLVMVGTMIGLCLTPVGLLYSDVGRAIPLLMQFLMYVTPVVFPMPKEGWAATLFQLNPLSPLILTTRSWLTGAPTDCLQYFLLVNAVALSLLLIFWVIYRLAMPILIERMSS